MNKKSPHTDITNPQTSLEEVDDKMETLVVEQLDDLDPTDEELDEILDNLDDDSSWEWDDDQLELDLDEDRKPLTLGQRMKRRILMKRLAPKIARQRKIKMRRKAGKEDLQKRARKAAITILKKKVAGAKGADYKNLSPSEKIGVDKLVQKRLGAVDKIAKRLMPKILKKETERVQSMRSGKVNEEFEALIEKKVSQDPDVDERPGTQPKKYFAGVRKKSKEARAKHFERGTKMSDDDPSAYKPAPGDAGAKTKPSKHTKKFKQMFGEQKMECPPATKDVALNTKNRNATRENHMYGPLNVKEPGDYWEKIADKWDTSVEAAKKSNCSNCVAFDISPRMEECMPGPVSDDDGRLGYCWMHHFKCHSARTCDTWATGGPIKEDDKSYQWQEKSFGKKEDINEEVTAKQISDLEKFGDRLLAKFDVDIEFSRHFADRMNDSRNNPEIKVAEIQALFKKIARKKAANIKKHANSEVVLKDIQKDLNLPVAIKMDKDGEIDVVHKTIMRKKNFKTPNAVVQYEETQLDEGVNDPAIFKAVFLAGGPGSGKSFIVGKTGLVNIGMKLVNSDDEFERRLKNAGLDAGNPDDIYSPQGQALRGKAKKTTANKQDMYINGRLGLVLDGTGKDYDKIKKVRDQLVRIGYDTAMIFVNTNLETSLERNRKRSRSLPDAEVEKMWKGVQDNMGKFQRLFGNDFTIVDNSEGADTPGETNAAYKKMVKFAKQPPKTRAAKNWISQEKSRRNIKEDTNEVFEKIMIGLDGDTEYLEEKQIDALKKKSEKSGIPYGILKKVYDRGMAAWRTGHRPGTTPQQWAFARVNSFATKSKGTWGGADKDLAAKARGSMKKEEVNEVESVDEKVEFETDKDLPNLRKPKKTTNYEFNKYLSKLKGAKSRERDYFKSNPRFEEGGAGEEGTDKLVKKYKKDTPSQMDERKSPYQKLRDFDKSRQAVGKKSMFNDKPTEFVRMKKPGAMTTMNVPSNEIDKYVKMGYKAIKENDAVNALKKDHNKEKEALKDKHDREMDTARLRDTRTKNMNEAFEMSMQTQAGMGETMFAKDFIQIRAGYAHHPDVEEALEEDYGWEEETDFVAIDEGAAEYQGRKVDLNNPTKSDNPKKKYMVYVKNDKGNVVKVHFGDPNMSIKRDDPERRKSFRARHGCDVDPGPKWKAKYWSCKFWSTKSVSDLMKG